MDGLMIAFFISKMNIQYTHLSEKYFIYMRKQLFDFF
jgi:hypothetical protein